MNVNGDPFVIEYNVRLGDPETQAVLPRIKNDLVGLLLACSNHELQHQRLETDDRYAVTVVLASGGYPGDFTKGKTITCLEQLKTCLAFHAGTVTDRTSGLPKTNGGRVIAITALNINLEEARLTARENAETVTYEGKYFRTDIGLDVMNYKS